MKKLITTAILSLITTLTFAQPWVKGGNNGLPPGSQPILGTDATWNAPLRIVTNGIERFKIMPFGTTNADGRIAMGNNLAVGFIPRSRLHLHHDDVSNISLRFTNSSTGTGNGDGFEVGYRAISPIINRQFAELNNIENTAMKFFC